MIASQAFKSRHFLVLFLIILIAFVLRFYKLDSYPALNADEAAIGYNAYSLLETGKDEHGNPWPIHFQSFNDYKPGLYVYMVVPFVKVLGLNEWSVRIPGALIGVLTVIVVYFLAKHFSDKSLNTNYYLLPTLASLGLAISPWHIHFSRGGWEVNVATFFISLGVLFLLKAFTNPKYFILCVLSFTLALYTYHAARIVVPLLVLGIGIINLQSLKKNLKIILISGFLGILLLAPLIKDFASGEVASRAAGVGLFADTGPLARINEQRGEHADYSGPQAKILHNKPVNYTLAFLENWSEHYWGEFLFLSGDDIQRNKVPETGQFYLVEIVFILAGFAAIAKNLKPWKSILLWLLVAPIAAALTFQSPHALRAHNMVIPLTLISALGLMTIINYLGANLRGKLIRNTGYVILITIIVWGFIRYEHMYWLHMSKEYPYSSQYGVKQLANFVTQNGQKYKNIVITDRYDQPYILMLFFSKYSPKTFQNSHVLTPRDQFGFSTVENYDKFVFKQVQLEGDRVQYPNSLIIGTDEQIPKEANIIKKIYGSNGHLYFEVVEN